MRTLKPYILSTVKLKKLKRRRIGVIFLNIVLLIYYFTGGGEKISLDKFSFLAILFFMALTFYLFYYKEVDKKIRLKIYKISGDICLRKNDYDGAIRIYNKALELNLEDADIYNNCGLAYSKKGDYDRAIEDYNKAIELNPKDAAAYYNRGLAYKALGKQSETQRDFEKARLLSGKYIKI